ncbi:MAG: PhnE/PtxC family ABC transporter permease, partial [Anaerolineales bacterium]
MTTIPQSQEPERRSLLQTILSLIVPGLGQAVGGAISRGIFIFLTVGVMYGLTVWTSAQRPRFPDYGLAAKTSALVFLEAGALLIFIGALYYLSTRTIAQHPATQATAKIIFIVLAAAAVALTQDMMLAMVLPEEQSNQLYGMTLTYGAALVAAIWYWNVADAGWVRKDYKPGITNLVLLGSLALLVLGTRVTQIDMAKAIREYQDTQIILRRIVWPWRAAFDYDVEETRSSTKLQAPCPEGATGPEQTGPSDDEPWVVVDPACGDPSERTLEGELEFGTQVTIEGGNFLPGETARIRWQNPIGNSFTPRGVGEAEFVVNDDGTFSTELYIPELTIPSTARGEQIHTIHVIQTGARTFTGALSQDMKLALQQMLVTIMMGMMATFVGVVLALPASFLAARNLMVNIKSTIQGFVGGVIGLAFGAWLGRQLAMNITARIGGLQAAPVQTAAINFVLVFGGAILFYRLAGTGLDRLGKRALPDIVARIITLLGMAGIGAAVGYQLGRIFANTILAVTQTPAIASQMAPQTGMIGAAMGALALAIYAWRHTPFDELTTGNFIYAGMRVLMNIIRSIEPLILAVVGIIWVGPGPFAGFMALTAHTIAALGKLYSESIESIDPGPIEAVQA